MSLLSELKTIIEARDIPVETGVFSSLAPDVYVVLTPMTDTLSAYADNYPQFEIQEVRVSLYDKGNYNATQRALTSDFLDAGITITDRRYIGREDDSGYNHFAVDTAQFFEWEEST